MIGLTVTPGGVCDSALYLEHIHKNVIRLQAAAADSAYDFPPAHRVIEELGIEFLFDPSQLMTVPKRSSNGMPQFNTRLAAGLRGGGRPLFPSCHGLRACLVSI